MGKIFDDKFYQKAIDSICGTLGLDKALQRCLLFLRNYMPADQVSLHYHDVALGTIEDFAIARLDETRLLNRTIVIPKAFRQLLKFRTLRGRLLIENVCEFYCFL